MRGLYRCSLVLVASHICLVLPATSQTRPTGTGLNVVGSPVTIPGQPAKEAFIVAPDGQTSAVSRPPKVRFQTEILKKQESVDDILGRHNFAVDDKTREMLRGLNPSYDASPGGFPAGTKIDTFVVQSQGPIQATRPKFTFDSPNLTRLAFHTQADVASEISKTASRLPPKAFGSAEIAKVHIQTTQDIQKAADTLQAGSDKLTKMDVAVAQYQIDLASKQAAAVNASAAKGTVGRNQVLAAQASAQAAKETADRVEAGKPAAELKNLTVNVYKGSSDQHVRPLQVYVLPVGALEGHGAWSKAELESFINHFSFANDASPVSQDIPTNFDPRVCVGPKNAVSGMAQLIISGTLTTCRKPDMTAGASGMVLTFRSPEDVARPRP